MSSWRPSRRNRIPHAALVGAILALVLAFAPAVRRMPAVDLKRHCPTAKVQSVTVIGYRIAGDGRWTPEVVHRAPRLGEADHVPCRCETKKAAEREARSESSTILVDAPPAVVGEALRVETRWIPLGWFGHVPSRAFLPEGVREPLTPPPLCA